VDRALEALTSSLLAREEVTGVYLCGSWAKGTHTAASDVDLLVMIKDGSRPSLLKLRDRVPAYLPDRFPVSLDLFVLTAEEAKDSSFAGGLLEHAVPLGKRHPI